MVLGSKATAAPAKAGWQVLVLNQIGETTKSSPPKWSTTWSDGSTAKQIDGFIVSANNQLWSLKVLPSEGACSCKEGKYPFSYSVDHLVATTLSNPTRFKVLLGETALESARAVMRDHQASCDGIKQLPGQPDSTESYERSRLRLLSNYNGRLGVELVSESFYYGRPTAMVSNDWASYRLDKDPVTRQTKSSLPSGAASEAVSRFTKLATSEREQFSPGDFSHFVFVPSNGGTAVEFGVPGTAEAVRNQVRIIRIDRPDNIDDSCEKVKQSFVSLHPKLIKWSKASFYTIAPDSSAAVFALAGNLYWQSANGKPKLLGPVKAVRGWQWHHGAR